nr:MAG TPA: Protein of unknown function (DUF4027) [Caudoviricetes sp.]
MIKFQVSFRYQKVSYTQLINWHCLIGFADL